MKNHKLAIAIAIILFIVPFFWLKPGEMNLGGDAGRLYFYDPYAFIKNYGLYNFIASGKGVESIGYVFLPYVFTLFILKFIFQSPTTLIAITNGVTLSFAFLSVYFIILELIRTKEFPFKGRIIEYSSILAGFFYILSQELMFGGWENAIITHNQFFVNPLMFLLLLKYLLTKNNLYGVGALFVSFIFAPNFAYIGAPTFFAFYPLALIFLLCFIKFTRKRYIPYKSLGFGILLFLLLHAFHLFSELFEAFSFTSTISKTIFSTQEGSSRGGLDYFIAIASSTKVSFAWMSLTQIQKEPWHAIFIIMPLVLVCGFFFNKGKTLLLSGVFFLITLFFATANITDIGFFFYKQLFKIPGFSMFRNFHGQWVYVFMFFYTVLFGQAIAIIANRLNTRYAFAFIGAFLTFILLFGIPFLNGSIPMLRHEDTGLRFTFIMDPKYEKVLDYSKTDSIDGKTISFPFTGPGYQVLQGLDGGVYQGLPIISYVGGKSDFAGFGSLYPYDDMFLEYMKQRDYSSIKKLFSIMNIKSVFYNSDPFIYSDAFTNYLYAHVSQYDPKDQKEYKAFVESLPVSNRLDFGNKYHIYTVNADTFLPHIFATTSVPYTNNQLSFTIDPYLNSDARTAPVSVEDTLNRDNVVLFAPPETFLSELENNSHLHRHEPFISRSLDDIFYTFVLLKEKLLLYIVKNNSNYYFDRSLLFLTKRISELARFGEEMSILKHPWKEPKLWEIYRFSAYNSWEASLARYQNGMEELIDWVANSDESFVHTDAQRIKINEQFFRHQLELVRTIRSMHRKSDEKIYIFSLTNAMFEQLFRKVNISMYNSSQYYYDLPDYPGFYNVFLKTKDTSANLEDANIVINNQTLKPLRDPVGNIISRTFLQFDNYSFVHNTDTRFTVNIPPDNLVANTKWSNSGNTMAKGTLLTFIVNNNIGENTKGLMLNIPYWEQKNTYLITFDYLTDGDNFIFSLYDKLETNDSLRRYGYRLLFEKILNSKTWRKHQSIVTEKDESYDAFMQIAAFTEKDISKMYIKNLSITKIKYPTMIFKKIVSGSYVENRQPAITFTKINPTKYSVHVEGAKSPYGLVFLESFNNNWKIIDPTLDENTAMASVFRFMGLLGKNIVGLFFKDELKQKSIVASYFNGDVQEGTHKNIFLAPSTFETWGKSAIAQDKHGKTFDYANAWIINPEDMQGRSEYTFIIEMQNHKKFYIFGFVSILTFIFLITYSLKKLVLKHEKNN